MTRLPSVAQRPSLVPDRPAACSPLVTPFPCQEQLGILDEEEWRNKFWGEAEFLQGAKFYLTSKTGIGNLMQIIKMR
jgi:hypothetical protein